MKHAYSVAIDASRSRSGGAVQHLCGILGGADPREHGFREVSVFSYQKLLDRLPSAPWLRKHHSEELERSLPAQLYWQRYILPRLFNEARCDILLNTDAGSVGTLRPCVTMSRDMLCYEKGEMRRYGFSRHRVRAWILKHVQARSLRRANGAIFLTRYAARRIQECIGPLREYAIIPHGVGESFRLAEQARLANSSAESPTRIVYVSNFERYKHQWMVIRAVKGLRNSGYNVKLTLAGGAGPADDLVNNEVAVSDPQREFVEITGAISHGALPALLAKHDVFVFASSCENMPNTLVEGMAAGLPIACSNRGPMPEILEDGGIYFDPEDPSSITRALKGIIENTESSQALARRAQELAHKYSWRRCARETYDYLHIVAEKSVRAA